VKKIVEEKKNGYVVIKYLSLNQLGNILRWWWWGRGP
jgi:hypothetical protein